MRTIYKFPVPVDDVLHKHAMPTKAVIRHVAQQGYQPCIWAEVDTDAPLVERSFRVFGTGHAIPDGFAFVGTAFDGPFVWHVFEKLTTASNNLPTGE